MSTSADIDIEELQNELTLERNNKEAYHRTAAELTIQLEKRQREVEQLKNELRKESAEHAALKANLENMAVATNGFNASNGLDVVTLVARQEKESDRLQKLCTTLASEVAHLNDVIQTYERKFSVMEFDAQKSKELTELMTSQYNASEGVRTKMTAELSRSTDQYVSLGVSLALTLKKLGLRHWQHIVIELRSAARYRQIEKENLREELDRVASTRQQIVKQTSFRVLQRLHRRSTTRRSFSTWLHICHYLTKKRIAVALLKERLQRLIPLGNIGSQEILQSNWNRFSCQILKRKCGDLQVLLNEMWITTFRNLFSSISVHARRRQLSSAWFRFRFQITEVVAVEKYVLHYASTLEANKSLQSLSDTLYEKLQETFALFERSKSAMFAFKTLEILIFTRQFKYLRRTFSVWKIATTTVNLRKR